QVFATDWTNSAGPYNLPLDGTYRLLFYTILSLTGSYGFTMCNPILNTTALTVGTPTSGTLAGPGDQAAYTFGATKGERIFFNPSVIGPKTGTHALLSAPSGTQVFATNWASAAGPYNLPLDGTYRLLYYTDHGITGTYGFTLRNPLLNTAALMLGTP